MTDTNVFDENLDKEEFSEHHEEHEHEHEHHHDHEHEHHHDDDHEHEHHHHHDDDDDDCGCHDHEHEHHHHHGDDDDDCDCHDHEHEHEHHHHHHDHGKKYDVEGFKLLETHKHEGATICSFEKEVEKNADDVKAEMEKAINNLEKWLDENDAMIGHVKGYVKEAGKTTTFSTVGLGLNIENHDSTMITVGFASIVFGPEDEELKDKVVEFFKGI